MHAWVEIVDESLSGAKSAASWPFFFHENCVTCASVERRGDKQEREDQPRTQVFAVLRPLGSSLSIGIAVLQGTWSLDERPSLRRRQLLWSARLAASCRSRICIREPCRLIEVFGCGGRWAGRVYRFGRLRDAVRLL